jgi:poly(3-hydroxybutyrate) depolymerase
MSKSCSSAVFIALLLGCGSGIDAGGSDAGSNTDTGSSSDAAVDAQLDATSACTATCDNHSGLCAPEPTCSPTAPCSGSLVQGSPTTTLVLPACKTSAPTRGSYDDAPAMTWTDEANGTRAACVFRPTGSGPWPLVVFLHGGGQTADILYDATSLRAKAATFALGTKNGFILAADQGRNLHAIDGNADGPRHDIFYRDLSSPSTNPDIAALDRLIDTLVSNGGVDRKRIYVIGWSNGGFFAQFYAFARGATPTPGGNRVAAAVAYASGDPFESPLATLSPACDDRPYPTTGAPIAVYHRACDYFVGCDEAQRIEFSLPPGFAVHDWLGTLASLDPSTKEIVLDANGALTSTCAPVSLCTHAIGAANHLMWPDGVADKSGHDWELEMLAFMRNHALSQ